LTLNRVNQATEAAMVNLFHQGGTTSLAPASSLDRLGPRGANLFQYFLSKAKLRLMDDFGLGAAQSTSFLALCDLINGFDITLRVALL